MSRLRLTLSCGLYEITRALVDGEVSPDGIELTCLTDDPLRIYSLARHREADIGELNITEFFRAREHEQGLIGLPVFPHRRFREGYYFVNTGSGIGEPRDLVGRRIAISGVTPAAGVWMRGVLQERHGVPSEQVQWLENPLEPIGDAPAQTTPPQVTEQTLLSGEADALISPTIPRAFEAGDPRIARLFSDHVEQSIAYYRATGIFPIMHVVTVREELLERHPWIARSLYDAFDEAKRIGYRRVANPRLTPLALFEAAWERQRELLGPDPWEYGLSEANRHNVETILRYTREQGRIRTEPPLSDLFVDLDQA